MNLLYPTPLRYVAGTTAPSLLLRVEAYPQDPTGATAVFKLAGLFNDYLTTVVGTATLGTPVAVVRDGLTTYDFDLEFAWNVADLVAGLYYGRFTLTDGADVYAIPADRSMVIEVLPAPQVAP